MFNVVWIVFGIGMVVYSRVYTPLIIPATQGVFGEGTYLDAGLIFIAWGIIRYLTTRRGNIEAKGDDK